MASPARLRPLLHASRPLLRQFHASPPTRLRHPSASTSAFLPRILQPTTWFPSLGSKKRSPASPSSTEVIARRRQWNPATFFIWIFLLIGSQAIQVITLRLEHADKMRRADAKIGVLREVIDRLQRGEEVDVKKMLGTGDEREEKDWEEVLREIEEEDTAWMEKRKTREKKEEEDTAGEKEAQSRVEDAPKRVQARSASDYKLF